MMFIATYGYQQFARYWNEDFGHYNEKFSLLRGLNILGRTLLKIKPYLVIDETGKPYFFFEGGVSVIRSVISNSVSEVSMPGSFQLKVEEDEQTPGKLKLTYSELPFTASNYKNTELWQNYTYQITILRGLDDIAFSYLGWAHYDEYLASDEGNTSLSPQRYYSGKDTWMVPNLVTVNIVVDGQQSAFNFSLPFIREDLLEFYSTSNN